MAKPIVEIQSLGKRYRLGADRERYLSLRDELARRFWPARRPHNASSGEFWALRDVSLCVQPGEAVAIIGRNGAGKSTLLKILSQITPPSEGRILVRGRIASLLEVGTGFHPELTGRENIYLNGAILGMTRAEIRRKFDDIVAFAEVDRFLDTPVKRYSSGMYVRLAFAVAAHLEPEILVVDEVLAVGDAAYQNKCLGKMGDVAHGGRTVLFVSHNMAAVQRLCKRAVLLSQGRVVALGDAEEVTAHYLREGAASELDWRRPSPPASDHFFERIWVSDPHGQPASHVTTGGQLRVMLQFVVGRPCAGLQVTVGLLDSMGQQIFGSSPLDGGERLPETPGRYVASITFPPEILLAKPYGLRASLWHPTGGSFDWFDALRFVATETASLGNSTPGGRAGVLALRCHWALENRGAVSPPPTAGP